MAVEKEDLDPVFSDREQIDVDANVRKVVKTLLVMNDMTADRLAELLRMSRSTLYTRLAVKGKRSRFTVTEVYRMSRVFDVKVGTFYEPPELTTFGYISNMPGDGPKLTGIDGTRQGPARRGLPFLASV